MTVMNDSFESDERKRKETIECLYWSLMNGWDIPKDIREHYGFSEDYELYHRLESMEPEDYRERRLRGEIPEAVEVDVRLTHAVEKVFERLCSPPPVQYLDKLYGELEKLGGFIANPKNIDSPFINSCFLMKYGIDRNSPDEIRRQQAEKAYKELYARFETMVGRSPQTKRTTPLSERNAGSQPAKTGFPGKSAFRSVLSRRNERWDFERFSKTRTTSLKKDKT